MATARVPAPVRRTYSPRPPDRVTSLSKRAAALAFRCANASASSRAAVSGSASVPALDAPPPSDPRTGTTRSLFCFGLGYTSLGLAETLRRAGWRVAGTCRSAERARALEAAGIPAFVWDPEEEKFLGDEAAAALRDATHVLVSVPPTERPSGVTDETDGGARRDDDDDDDDASGPAPRFRARVDPVLADAACVAALRRRDGGAKRSVSTRATGSRLAWLAYLSSTGVYGDHSGDFVDETSPCVPMTGKTRARFAAEREWEAFARSEDGAADLRLRVFRLGGVYGPRRSLLDAAARGNASAAHPPERASAKNTRSSSRFSRAFTARCHARDVVAMLCASISRADRDADPTRIRTYNAVDDAPAPRAVALAFAEALLADARGGEATADAASVSRGATDSTDSAKGPARVPDGASRVATPPVAGAARVKNDRGEKRVRNDRAKTELGVELAFPTYAEGLAAIADGDTSPFSDALLDVL